MSIGGMSVNRHVIVSAVVIMAGGVLRVWLTKQGTITRTVVGAMVFLLLLSIIDLFGGQLSTLASALAMLAMVYVLFNDFLPLLFKQGILKG